jgi:hypothetical protein
MTTLFEGRPSFGEQICVNVTQTPSANWWIWDSFWQSWYVYDHRWWVSYFATRQCGQRTETSSSQSWDGYLLDRWIKQCDSNSFQTLKLPKSILVTCNRYLKIGDWEIQSFFWLLELYINTSYILLLIIIIKNVILEKNVIRWRFLQSTIIISIIRLAQWCTDLWRYNYFQLIIKNIYIL